MVILEVMAISFMFGMIVGAVLTTRLVNKVEEEYKNK